jgi:hypothetical protein
MNGTTVKIVCIWSENFEYRFIMESIQDQLHSSSLVTFLKSSVPVSFSQKMITDGNCGFGLHDLVLLFITQNRGASEYAGIL